MNPKALLKEYMASLPSNSLVEEDDVAPEALDELLRTKDQKLVKEAQDNLFRAIQENIGIENPENQDFLTDYGIKDILSKCANWKRDDLVQIDCPEEIKDDSFKKEIPKRLSQDYQIFAGYVRPGFHSITIYEPESDTLYHKTVYIKPRETQI